MEEKDKTIEPQRGTTIQVNITRHAVHDTMSSIETDAMIWKSCRNKDICLPIRQFLFKVLHNTHWIEQYWDVIPQYKQRVQCSSCNYPNEDLEHILLDCPTTTRISVWNLAKKLWPHPAKNWPHIKLGTILGYRMLTTSPPPNAAGPDNKNTKREKG